MPKCPHCQQELTPAQIASLMGQIESAARSKQARINGAKNSGKKSTGRPKGSKDKAPRKTKTTTTPENSG